MSAGRSASSGRPSAFSSFVERSLDLRITQPIYRGGRTEAQTRQAINQVQATRAQTLAAETTVFQAVRQAFLDVVRDQTLVEVDRNNEAVLNKQLDATRDRFRVGEVTRTDVAQAESRRSPRRPPSGSPPRASWRSAAPPIPARSGIRRAGCSMPKERPVLPATRDEALALPPNDNPNVIAAHVHRAAARDNVDAGARPVAAADLDRRRSQPQLLAIVTLRNARRTPLGHRAADDAAL